LTSDELTKLVAAKERQSNNKKLSPNVPDAAADNQNLVERSATSARHSMLQTELTGPTYSTTDAHSLIEPDDRNDNESMNKGNEPNSSFGDFQDEEAIGKQ